MKAESANPRAYAVVGDIDGANLLELSPYITGLSTQRQYGSPVGGFSISLRWDVMDMIYKRSVQPNQLITIRLNAGRDNEENNTAVMIGLISRISESISIAPDGKPSRYVKINGMDMGKLLVQHSIGQDLIDIFRNPGDEQLNRYGQFLGRTKRLPIGGTPDRNIMDYLETLFYARIPWTREWILADKINCEDRWITDGFSAITRDGSIWSCLKSLANEPFNVLHGDTGEDGKFHIALERAPFYPVEEELAIQFEDRDNPNPFSTKYLDSEKPETAPLIGETGKLRRAGRMLHTVDIEEIESMDVGVDDAERINFMLLRTLMLTDDDNGSGLGGLDLLFYQHGPHYDDVSIARNGCRQFVPQTEYAPVGGKANRDVKGSPDIVSEVLTRSQIMWEWYRNAHTYKNGVMKIHGRPEIRSGHGIVTSWDNHEYFVEMVQHHFEFGSTLSTTLHLTRGQPH